MQKTEKFKSLRPFIGAKNFEESRSFYKDLDFSELVLSEFLIYYKITDKIGFYLQKANVKDWIDNTMLFLEVENLEAYLSKILAKNLTSKYPKVKISKIVKNDWGNEFFLHDPSGILWHFGYFKN